MKKLCLTLALLMLSLLNVEINAKAKWTLKKENNNIKIYVREVKGSEYKEFKAITIIDKTKLATLIALLDDASAYPKWIHNCKKAKVLKDINKRERITYSVIRSPWPVSDRDNIAHSKIIQNLKTYEVKVLITGRPNYIVKSPDYVRIPYTKGYWSFTPLKSGMVKIVFQMYNEPGGSVPTSLVNAFIVDMPYYTLKKMRTIIKEKKYRDAKYPQIKELKH